jgi:hypothetical protein
VAQFVFPVCACDETVEPVADDLEPPCSPWSPGTCANASAARCAPGAHSGHSPGMQRRGLVIELGGEHGSSSWSLLDGAERRQHWLAQLHLDRETTRKEGTGRTTLLTG